MPLFKSFLWKYNIVTIYKAGMTLSFSVPRGRPLTLWTSSKHNNQGLYTAQEKTDTMSSLFFSCDSVSPMVSLSLPPAGTSNQIKTWGPVSLNSEKTETGDRIL